MATGFVSNAQNENHKLIAVVNTADWCIVCKANAKRFNANLMPYTAKGLAILLNNLTNDTTMAVSKTVLENAGVYQTVYAAKRKGMGKMLQSCGLIKGKTTNCRLQELSLLLVPDRASH